ncbi:MAG: hypothetical protein P9M11_02110 [Candidatus Tenebribacter burtonii]|nr:hypothetical protein [Candidatus Tenebribacter burtonii]
MDIEFMMDNVKAEQHLIDFINNIMTTVLNDYEFDENLIDYIIFADNANFGKALSKYSNQKTYTNNEYYFAVGKIIENYHNKVLTHSIIFHDSVFTGVIAGKLKGSMIDEWDINEAKSYYVIYHEIAHCIDGHTRGISKKHTLEGGFRIHSVANYYIDKLIDEFYCSVISARGMYPKAFKSKVTEIMKLMSDGVNDAIEYRNKIKNSDEEKVKIALQISGLFWLILIQISKLIGIKIGNCKFEDFQMTFTKDNLEANRLIIQFESYLKSLWQEYPTTLPNINKHLFNFWNDMTLVFGYKFETTKKGDSIYWNENHSLDDFIRNLKY